MQEKIKNINNLIENKDFQKAKEALFALENDNSPEFDEFKKDKDFFVQKNLGLCNVNLNLYNEAVSNFEKAVEIKSEDATGWYYLGILYENLKEIEKAENAYLNVIKLRETFPDAYKNLAIIYMKKRDLNKAYTFAQKANEYNPGDYQSYYIMSSILITQNCPDKVIEILEKGIKLKPDHSNMNANLGGAYLDKKEYEKAYEYLSKAVELDPKNAIAYNLLTNYYLAKEDFKKAYESSKKVYELEPSEVFLVTLAMCSLKGEVFEEAVKYYKTLSVMHPEKQHYQISLAQAYIGMKDYKPAEDILFRMYNLNPKSEMIGKNLVECYKASGNIQMAIMILKRMIARGNISAEIHYDYAILSASVNDYDTALAELRKVIKLKPENAIAHKDLAVIYLLRNQMDYAKDEFETAYNLDKTSFSIVFEYANFLNQSQEFERSKELYEKAIEISNGENSEVFLYAAINLISLNEIEKAYDYLMKANKEMPDNFEALSNLGKVMFFMGKFKEAKEFCLEALKINKNAETKNILATSLMALDEYNDALQIFLELYELNKNNINLMLSITKCYYELKDFDNALTVANKILALLPECEDAQEIVNKIKKGNKEENNNGN